MATPAEVIVAAMAIGRACTAAAEAPSRSANTRRARLANARASAPSAPVSGRLACLLQLAESLTRLSARQQNVPEAYPDCSLQG